VDGFGLSFDEAIPIFEDWNRQKAQPPESDQQVQHKLEDAIKNHPRPSLRLLNADRGGRSQHADAGQHVGNGRAYLRTLPSGAVKARDQEPKEAQADALIRLAVASRASFFRTPEDIPYASIPLQDHVENHRLRSERFKLWLGRLFHSERGRTPSQEGMQAALDHLVGRALYQGPIQPVYVRVAEFEDRYYLDLVDKAWRAVEIDSGGWRITEKPPSLFRRTTGMLALPEPQRGGSLDQLRSFVNIGSNNDWLLFIALMTSYYRPSGPYPIMVLMGEQGCAKSTTARIVRGLLDPHKIPLRSVPKDEHNLMIAAANNWTLIR